MTASLIDRPLLPSRLHWILLALILACGIALRVHRIGEPSLWFDEDDSITVATGNWESIYFPKLGFFEHAPDVESPTSLQPIRNVLLEADANPPFYFICLRLWWTFFGMSDVSCRMLSVVTSVLAIVVTFDIARLIAGPTPATWAAAIMAVAPTQIYYAQEARNYALVQLLGAITCDVVLRIFRFGPTRRRWIVLSIAAVLTAWTHYFAVGGLAGVAIFALTNLRGRTRGITLSVLGAAIVFLIATRLPIIVAHQDVLRASVAHLVEPRTGLFGRVIQRAVVIPMWLITEPRRSAMLMGIPALLLLILPFYLDERRPGLLLCGAWASGVIGLVAISDFVLGHNALTLIRYTFAAAPMIVVSLVVLADLGGRAARHLLPAIAVVGALLGVLTVYDELIDERTEAKLWVADITSHVKPDDVLVVASTENPGLYRAGLEYLQLAHYAYPLACPVAIVEGSASEDVREKIWAHRRVWMAICHYYIEPSEVLGPCRVVQDGKNRYFAGRLVRVERVTEAPATTSVSGTPQ